MNMVPVILSGGRGARLWPVSRELHPKPFIRLSDGQSLLQKAFVRAASLPGVAEVVTVTNRDLYFKTADEYAEVNPTGVALGFLLESEGRNTAPAIAAAALAIGERRGEDAVLLVLTADHLIADLPAFTTAVTQAAELAQQGRVVTFGIRPEHPETGYGYIEAQGNDVLRFVEKPDLETAREYVDSGRFLWNSGMFCLTVKTALAELETHAPEVLATARATLAASQQSTGKQRFQIELDPETFATAPDLSIDYALMEKTQRAAVVPCAIGWSDVGSWNAIGDLIEPDVHGNRVDGDAMLHDSENCYVRSHDRLVSAVGVHDLVIVDTPDALLVADKNRVQDVKRIVDRLRADDHDAHRLHRTVHRPWGTYTTLEEGDRFKIKRIVVTPGQSLSLQMHHHRSEHWIVVSGMASIVNGESTISLGPNQSTYIPAGCQHRLSNPGKLPLILIEVQSGEYLGEDDIVRFEDIYGRN
ncbi:mannose-1-phosphate guanylyltransferase/mannose-6-phosphate isomerase [Achromobacter sp. GG226]|uniref:mannose-1-phosphate guanylyltransferase/mannose-6-phosphate isomerase n=1 Tax=Verticiella alkaliphila TaxID=2779529 RepID=UPI001C0C7D94|nr:mannose-1-phosphate guanylyltransferase/mannose-6-phosphate isomerase [Verticiella sp. GG226]MBU4613021.1 mannose-1-phosphate guanylyltransferase/mannose-6-phosphate isomerase [Verticiella sp. GG226]